MEGGIYMITLENFNENNRERRIGNSLYRICNTDTKNTTGKWYINETYNDGSDWCRHNYYFSDNLSEVIDKINSFTKEKEIVSFVF